MSSGTDYKFVSMSFISVIRAAVTPIGKYDLIQCNAMTSLLKRIVVEPIAYQIPWSQVSK